jgi:hypothetical protein
MKSSEGQGFNPAVPTAPPHPQPLSPWEGGEGGRRPGEGVQFGGTEVPPFRISVTTTRVTKH